MAIVSKKQKQHSTLFTSSTALLPLAEALADDEEKEGVNKEGVNNKMPASKSLVDETKLDENSLFCDYSEDGLPVSEAVYWADYYEHPNFNYEWNNGILEEKGMSDRPTYLMYAWFWQLLQEYLKHHPIAQTTGLEIGGQILLPNKTAIRKPDLGVILHSNPIPYQGKVNTYQGTFDMVIEAVSKTQEQYKLNDTVNKKQEYALGGVKEYYILDGDKEETVFYRLNKQGAYQEIKSKDGVIRSEVLPGFQFRESDLYTMPPIDELRHDQVYKHFVGLGWQDETKARRKETQARQLAEQQAKIEAQARQQAEQRANAAEAEIARLKALLDNS